MRKRIVSIAKRSRAVHGVGRLLDSAVPAPNRICTVLTFHRIETHEPDLYPGLAGLDASGFSRFMDQLADRFRPIGVGELLGALSGDIELPARSVLVTFDDAYRDFAEVAWPIMRDRGVPVVLFVPTSFPDHPTREFWWDELYSAVSSAGPAQWQQVGIDASSPDEAFRSVRDGIKSMPHDDAMQFVRDSVATLRGPEAPLPDLGDGRVLGWAEIDELGSAGVDLAPHSRTHPMLDRLPPDQLDAEIRGSLDDLCGRLGSDRVTPVFAYPSGGHDPRVRAAVERAGFTAAFTTERGLVDVERSDHFRLPRLNIGRDSTVGAVGTEAAIRRLDGLARSARRGRPG
jgi:peptidoglycan/xylan/chitin deacetylase (PgdA/CDA1 family)